ncbi:hypothetical protein RAH32_13675 [Paracoccus sp. WLY502]|uniref:hypothetical protein n=1 Tax=Paracoccus yibinensis TaxID=3068891 RepID=UPI0027969253|nr:hypothetical protein [Paracoccus sp. WLY502]MDQ1901495.1 hypothetical protein [Paracoccus sp. WLY502]
MDTTGLPEQPQDKATALAPELVAAGEDARHVPVLADATGLGPVDRMVVTIDYSPFPLALVFHPGRALPLLGFGVNTKSPDRSGHPR